MSLPSYSVRNPVFANLLMVLIMIAGTVYALSIRREIIPNVQANQVLVTVPYPGASAFEVEEGILTRIEEKVRDIEGVDTVRSVAQEGLGQVELKLESTRVNSRRVMDDVKTAVDQIDTFPDEAETPVVTEAEPLLPAIAVALYGKQEPADTAERERLLRRLKALGEQLEDELLTLPEVSRVDAGGMREAEVQILVREEDLLRWNLTFDEVVSAVRATNVNIPGGSIRTEGGDILLRALGETERVGQIERVTVRARADGSRILLRDVADVREGFKDSSWWGRFSGRFAVDLTVFKAGDEDAVAISDAVRRYVEDQFAPRLPPGIGYGIHNDLSKYIRQRIDLMTRNAFWGLLLVFLSLALFLNLRMSMWVALGIPISFLGMFVVMAVFGVTVNMVTLFGMIIVLGMIVDDAIVIGENSFRHIECGMPPRLAAVQGAEEVQWPVIVTIATTMATFLPIMAAQGMVGEMMWGLPVVVCAALGVSLIESLVILPAHLAEWIPARSVRKMNQQPGRVQRLRTRVISDTLLPAYSRMLRTLLSWRYATLGVALAVAIFTAVWQRNRVPFVMIPDLDADLLLVKLELETGAPAKTTEAVLRRLEDELLRLNEQHQEIKSIQTEVGLQFDAGASGVNALTRASHRGQIMVELVEADERSRSSEGLAEDLRAFAREQPEIRHFLVEPVSGGPPGKDLELEITGDDLDQLAAARQALKQRLAAFEGVSEITDNYRVGKPELVLELTPAGRAQGLTVATLASQVRAAYHGADAGIVQRPHETVDIVVRLPDDERRTRQGFLNLRLFTPRGGRVPLRELATVRPTQGLERITRTGGQRAIKVTAQVDEEVNNAERILAALQQDNGLSEHPSFADVDIAAVGEAEETRKSFDSLQRIFPVSMLLIYLMLATLFRSYLQPLVVMTAVPFGIAGAVWGHVIMGEQFTLLSVIGVVALSGIAVNDSLVLVDLINRRLRDRPDAGAKTDAQGAVRDLTIERIIESGRQRVRPVLLTSITTIFGLAPMMGETSFQARFLIGMAISITFGLVASTVLVLVIVPCLYHVLLDLQRIAYRLWHGESAPEGWTPSAGGDAPPAPGDMPERVPAEAGPADAT